MLVFGGLDDLNVLRSDLWLLEIRGLNATWTSLDPSTIRPSPRASHSTVLYNSQIVVTGGQGNAGEGSDSVMFDSWVFDIALERWKRRQLRGSSVPRVAYHTQHYAKGPGLLFIVFGASNRETTTNTIYYASSDKMLWSKLQPAGVQPAQRSGHAAAAWGGNMVMFGGSSPRTGVFGDTWWFQNKNTMWSQLVYSEAGGASPAPRAFHAYDTAGSYLLLHAGIASSGRVLSDMWSFHAGSKNWQFIEFPSSNAPEARDKHTMTVVNGNSENPFAVVFGGVANDGTVNEKMFGDTWIFSFNIRPTESGGALCRERLNGMGRFDGENDIVTVDGTKDALKAAASAFSEPLIGADVPTMTLEAWVLVKEFTSDWQSILSLGNSVTIQRFSDANYLSVDVCGLRMTGERRVYDATWHHVALVVGSGQMALYIDEEVDKTQNISADRMDLFDHSSQLRFGFGESVRPSFFYGLLDDVRLWSVMRTKNEIMDGMWLLTPSAPGLEGWWQFAKSNIDGSVKDVAPQQRHGNAFGVARLRRPAITASTVPCDRASFLSQKQLSRGTWTQAAAGGYGGAGHRRNTTVSSPLRRGGHPDAGPLARHSHVAIAVSSTRILIHGGVYHDVTHSVERVLSDLWMFDAGITIGNPWSQVDPVSTVSMYGVYGHHAVLWQKHSLIGFGTAQKNAQSDAVSMMTINANIGSKNMGMSFNARVPSLSYFSLVKREDDGLILFGGDVRHHGGGMSNTRKYQ